MFTLTVWSLPGDLRIFNSSSFKEDLLNAELDEEEFTESQERGGRGDACFDFGNWPSHCRIPRHGESRETLGDRRLLGENLDGEQGLLSPNADEGRVTRPPDLDVTLSVLSGDLGMNGLEVLADLER